jgi:uncharacterized protein (TIGR03663 family)
MTRSGQPPRDRSRALRALLAVTALAIAVRFVLLGARVFHWDEGRVGYWILRYHETGQFAYRPIVHGPFLFVVNDLLFGVLPASDFAARLPVALIGGLLPLAAWLFRDHLADDELVALGLFLAANPLLVYYSRFMRNDVLVAAFSVVALGFVVRAFDTARLSNLLPAAGAMGLAFTTKENALLYVACYLGAAALLIDHELVRQTAGGRSPRDVIFGDWVATARSRVRAYGDSDAHTGRRLTLDGLARLAGALAVAVLTFFAVVVFFYAPRPDLWQAFTAPGTVPTVLTDATVVPAEKFYNTWAVGGHQDHDYLPYLYDYLETMAYGAPAVVVFGVLGFVVDRYGAVRTGSRALVGFAAYWGVASVLGYPLATDIQAPWAAVHAVVPLAVPAAVGAAYVYRSGRSALESEDVVSVGLAAVLLFAAIGGAAAANVAYTNAATDEHKTVLQWAQPENDLKETLVKVQAVAATNDGTDVLFYGTRKPGNDKALFYVANESSTGTPPAGGPNWHSRLPLPWYLERYDASVTSTPPNTPAERAATDAPPVVFAYGFDQRALEPHLDAYATYRHRFKLWNEEVVVFIDRAAMREAGVEP